MAHERLRPQFLFDEEKIKQLKQLAPESFEDGKINFETLRQNLGDWAQDDEDKDFEHFGLFWPGKRDARRIASIPPQGTLEPVHGEGLKSDGTPDTDGVNDSKNIFIEGENLEVLKILQKSYVGKIKMIYIDPPYNTGNDFIYDDDFTEPLQEYLRRTGQVDEEGKPLTTNKRSDGRFHSKWLSMIYPRLRLARNLLRKDGIIFISIDDNEVHNLRAIANEVFGEENFTASLVWQSKKGGGSDVGTLVTDHEYILVYTKDFTQNSFSRIQLQSEELDQKDEYGPYRRGRELNKWGSNSRRIDRPTMWFPIQGPNGEEVYPIRNDGEEGCWRYGKPGMMDFVAKNNVEFVKRDNGTFIAYEKIRTTDPRLKPYRTWLNATETTADGSKVIKQLFDNKKVFDFAKPVGLLKQLIKIGTTDNEDIVLDFFAGSSSTAQALIELNNEEQTQKQFILIQLPEKSEETTEAFKSGFKNISDISKDRIRRYIKKNNNNVGESQIAADFKVFKLVSSNYREWNNFNGGSLSSLEDHLNLFNENPLRDDWKRNSLLVEILLNEGFSLSGSLQKADPLKSNNLVKVNDEFCEHSLLICLDNKINSDTIQYLKLTGNDIFICLDSAISNVDKLRLSDKGLIKTV
jgi:adenine-specific DNA-methyltransferase